MVGFVASSFGVVRNENGVRSGLERRRGRVVMQASALKNVKAFDKLFNMFRKDGGKKKEEEEEVAFEGTVTTADIHPAENREVIILTTNIVAKEGTADQMAKCLRELQNKTKELEVPQTCTSIAINRDPEDKHCFQVVEFLLGIGSLTSHQKSAHYQSFIREAQPLLAQSLQVHICRVRNGNVSEGLYPYGPGGEGGRDDMVYSRKA